MSGDNAQWYWNACENPFDKTLSAVWTPYSTSDNALIEQEYQNKGDKAELSNHFIHFHERIQVHKHDFNRQRPIKREVSW